MNVSLHDLTLPKLPKATSFYTDPKYSQIIIRFVGHEYRMQP